jgi:hypothetical protein
VAHAGNGNRSDPQKRHGSNCHPFAHACHDTRPGRGLLVRAIRQRRRGNELRLLFLRPMHGSNLRERRLLPAEWILRPTKPSAHAHATLISQQPVQEFIAAHMPMGAGRADSTVEPSPRAMPEEMCRTVLRRISKMTAVDQPNSNHPFIAVIGPSSCQRLTGIMSP